MNIEHEHIKANERKQRKKAIEGTNVLNLHTMPKVNSFPVHKCKVKEENQKQARFI